MSGADLNAKAPCTFCQILPKVLVLLPMTTMNISLPDGLKAYVDELVQTEGYGTSSEYVRELIRRDQDRRQFKEHLLLGMRSGVEGPMDAAFFASLRRRANSTRKPV